MTQKRTTMLIDDCSIDNFVNKKMILNYHFAETVLVFQNSRKALDYLRKVDASEDEALLVPGIIFLDLNMPVLNGGDFLKQYETLSKKIKDSCRIVVLSGTIDPQEMTTILKNPHVIHLIHKPLIKQNFDLLESILLEQVKAIRLT